MARLAAELAAAADPARAPRSGLPGSAAAAHAAGRPGDRHGPGAVAAATRPAPGGFRREGRRGASCCRRASSERRAWPPAPPASSCCKPDVADRLPSGTTAAAWSGLTASGSRSPRSARCRSGQAVRFSTPAFDGYVVNDNGEIRALGAVCTHMGCSLQFRPDWSDLRCPCHGASFDLSGTLANGRDRWREDGPYPGDAAAYPIELPDLVKPLGQGGQRPRIWSGRRSRLPRPSRRSCACSR